MFHDDASHSVFWTEDKVLLSSCEMRTDDFNTPLSIHGADSHAPFRALHALLLLNPQNSKNVFGIFDQIKSQITKIHSLIHLNQVGAHTRVSLTYFST